MIDISELELLSPYPILIQNVGHVVSPTLQKIVDVGYQTYTEYINTLQMTVPRYFEMLGLDDNYKKLSEDEKSELLVFDVLTSNTYSLNFILNSLSFFFTEKVDFTGASFVLYNPVSNIKYGEITRDNFNNVCNIILKLNFIFTDKPVLKPKNNIAKKLLEKLNRKPAFQGTDNNNDISLGNMISALCVQHNSYNMTNIWSLTVYQLYDQFLRQNTKSQIDISAMLWAAGRIEKFDSSLWFKLNKK